MIPCVTNFREPVAGCPTRIESRFYSTSRSVIPDFEGLDALSCLQLAGHARQGHKGSDARRRNPLTGIWRTAPLAGTPTMPERCFIVTVWCTGEVYQIFEAPPTILAGCKSPTRCCGVTRDAEKLSRIFHWRPLPDCESYRLGCSRLSLNRSNTLDLCSVVLLIGKPVPTFPEAL